MQQDRKRLGRLMPTIALAALTASVTQAQVQVAHYAGTTPASLEFEYRVANMPDFDQRRAFGTFGVPAGLPGIGGMYCVPTSAMNVFAYLANHGDPSFQPGSGDYQSSLYEHITLNIAGLGAAMGTHPTDGTNGTGTLAGYTQWLADYDDQDRYVLLRESASGWYCPTFSQLTASVLATGGVAAFAFGRYPIAQITDDYIQVTGRGPGHAITLNRAERTSGGGIIGYRDPADDSASFTTQSEFTTRLAAVDDVPIRFYSDSLGQWVVRTQSAMNFDPRRDDKVRGIDSYNIVYPKSMYSLGTTQVQAHVPMQLAGAATGLLAPVTFSSLVPALDADIDGDLTHYVAITKGIIVGSTPNLVRRHRLTGQSQTIAPVSGATDIALGRNRQVYVGGGNQLRRFDLDRPAGSQLLATINVGVEVSDVAYNDATDQVVVLSIPDRQIRRYPAKFTIFSVATVSTIPATVPLAGDGLVIVNPQGGKHWVLSEASNSLYGLTLADTGVAVQTLTHPALTDPRSFDFDDRGDMFVNNGGQVLVLRQMPAVGGWQTVPGSPFAGLPVGGGLRMSRSRDNYDPVEHSTPGWSTNIPPAELVFDQPVADCLPDFNGDDLVNGLDLAMLLGGWSPVAGSAASCGGITPCPFDLNRDARVNGLDIAVMLGVWGACD